MKPESSDLVDHGGLSEAEVAEARTRYGFNAIEQQAPRGFARLALEIAREPMFLLLLCAAGIYLVIGNLNEGILLSFFALLTIALIIVQENRSENALRALRELAVPTVRVVRGGALKKIPALELVPGDRILIDEGERVAADAIVRAASGLTVDEALLTGESIPVRKRIGDVASEARDFRPGGDDSPLLYAGTLVCTGHAHADVLRIGSATEMGRIGKAIERIDLAPTPLQLSLKSVVMRFALAAFAVSATLLLWHGLTGGNWLQGALSSLALGMAMLPEEFPMAFTILVALAAWRLAQQQVLARRPVVLQTLGGVSLLCVDKTGTLTENRLRLAQLVVGPDLHSIDLETPSAVARLGDAGCRLIKTAALASRRDSPDPIDRAIMTTIATTALTCHSTPATDQLVQEFPISPSLPAVACIWRQPDGQFRIVAKGAPEAILSLCHLDGADRDRWLQSVQQRADDGLRVLAVAEGVSPVSEKTTDAHQPLFRPLGLLAFRDPLRADATQTVTTARQAGITVVMITGDYPGTAMAIARRAGIDADPKVLNGEALDALSESELAAAVASTRVYARVRPEQKLQLVQLFKQQGHIVGMTGDGVNDAPALKAAHVGIAMGARGTDVAREAASIVLMDESLGRIVEAIRQGRRLQATLGRVMRYVTAIHVPIAGLALIPVVAGLPPLLLPAHVVLTEMVVDPMCSVAFAAAPDDPDLMKSNPARWQGLPVKRRDLVVGALQGLLLLGVCLLVYAIGIHRLPVDEARTLAVIALTAGNLGLVASHLIGSKTPLTILFSRERQSFWWLSSCAIGILTLCIAAPPIRTLFAFSVPSAFNVIASSSIALLAVLAGAVLERLFLQKDGTRD